MAQTSESKRLSSLFRLWGRRKIPILPYSGSPFHFKPDIQKLKDRHIPFSVFKLEHVKLAREAVMPLIDAPTFKDFESRAIQLWSITNSDFYNYVLSVAAVKRNDTKKFSLPAAFKQEPNQFFPLVAAGAYVTEDPGDLEELVLTEDQTGTDLDPEHRVAYFREDLGLNSHHWHWHIVYPWFIEDPLKDRKGELFYYMHRQMLARYDAERLSLDLDRVVPLDQWEDPIMEGYNVRLIDGASGDAYAPRTPGQILSSVDGSASIEQMTSFRERIKTAVREGYFVTPGGEQIPVAIDSLGAAVENSVDSPNTAYYGAEVGIHNFGHDLLAQINDPDGRYKNNVPGGPMGYTATAVRDPVFFRWHKFIDNLFEDYQQLQDPYTAEELSWDAVSIESVALTDTSNATITNVNTFTTTRTAEISYGLDFTDREQNVKVTMPCLDHDVFSYQIKATNTTSSEVTATVRIFLAPLYVRGEFAITMDEYRTLCIELDRFTATLAAGDTTVDRSCTTSSVTISWEQIVGALTKEDGEEPEPFCGCGWPENLLIPRGKTDKGMQYSLFVMLTDWSKDKVDTAKQDCMNCDNAASYCGLLNQTYPDKRAMGYPFDRRIAATDLDGFISGKSNMSTTAITITYIGTKED